MAKVTRNGLAAMGVPKRHWEASIKNIPDGLDYKSDLLFYLDNFESHLETGTGLLLYGPYSSGKSAIAACVLKFALSRFNVVGYWVRADDVVAHRLNEIMGPPDWSQLEYGELLVIDEVLARTDDSAGGFRAETLEALVRRRIDECRMTIITTNLRIRQHSREPSLEAAYPALFAALQECTRALLVDGHDWRRDA